MVDRFLCAICIVGVGIASAPVVVDAGLTPGDVLVSNGSTLKEYTSSGTVVQTFLPPGSPNSSSAALKGIVVSPDGRLHVFLASYNSPFQGTLETFDFKSNSWSQHTLPDWNIANVTYYGGISADSHYVYVPDGNASASAKGIIRFPLNDLSAPERFATSYNPHSVKVGLDGNIYAVEQTSLHNVHVFDPVTLVHIRDVTVKTDATTNDIAVAANGDFFLVDLDNTIYHEDASGNLIKKVTSSGIYNTDIEISSDGRILVGSSGNKVTLTNTNLDAFATFDTPVANGPSNHNFVAFTEVPEPSTAVLSLMAAGLVGVRRRSRSKR